ncbi:hypothetical protein PCANB_001569 [Pneumocystis canis]|nr:hypothetical protein PCK1_001561 [Pneumocystis canis]KAG5439270.1 hypothetical protein PCANB_001569 [Pneumocystis canis]
MFTQTPVGGRRVRNQRQWSRAVSGDRPAAPLPSSGASPSFSYGSPSINPPDIPTLHDTTVSLASALSAAQKNAQRRNYIDPNIITPSKQPKFLKQEFLNNKSIFSQKSTETERKKISQQVRKNENSSNISDNRNLQDNRLDLSDSKDYFQSENSDINQNIEQNNKITRYYLREHESIDGISHISLNYDATNNSMNPENIESRSYEEEELLYTQLNENNFKDFFDEIDYEYSISDDDKNMDSDEYTDIDDHEKISQKILNFIYFCWFMTISLSKQFFFYCLNSIFWPIKRAITIFLLMIYSILKITVRKAYTIFIIFFIMITIIVPKLLEKNFIDLKWMNISHSQPTYNYSYPKNTDELIQRLIFLEKSLKSYETMAQDIIQDKKNIYKAIKEIDVKRLENLETTKLMKKELNTFKNSIEKIKKEISNIKQQDNNMDLKIKDFFYSLSSLQKNISEYENQFINHGNSLSFFNKEVIAIKKSIDQIYKNFTNSQVTLKNNSNDKYITQKVINVLESYLPSHLAVKVNPKTGKVDISPEFWILLREIFPDRLEMNNTLEASFIKKSDRNANISSLMSWSNFLKNNEENIKAFIKSQADENFKKNEENESIITKSYFINTFKQNFKKIQDDIEKNLTAMKVHINDQFEKIDYAYKNKMQLNYSENLKNDSSIFNKAIETLIETALHKYSSDVLAKPDFALYSSGARINPFLTSPTYLQRPTKFIPNLLSKIFWDIGSTWGHPPAMAIHHENNVGMCWAFPGSIGQISIRLSEPIFLTDITIEHVHSNIAHDISTAPRDIELWIQIDNPDIREKVIHINQSNIKQSESIIPLPKSYIFVTTIFYNIFSTYSIQTFPVPIGIKQLNIPVENVVFRIISNWGNNKFTCLYRVRVHGKSLLQHKTDSNY